MDGLELRPCPFCGEKKVKIRADVRPGDRFSRVWHVNCDSCGGRTVDVEDTNSCNDRTYQCVLEAWRCVALYWNHIHGLDAWQTIVDKVIKPEFKPCPFCGEKSVGLCARRDSERGGRSWYVKCLKCGCRTSDILESNYFSETGEGLVSIWVSVIAAWNKRAN